MRSRNPQQLKISASLAIALGLIASPQAGHTQEAERTSLIQMEQTRVDAIDREWAQCDKISSEGLRLECTKQALASFESEILKISAKVRATLPIVARSEFDSTCRAWAHYLDSEKRFWLEMSEHQGMVKWIGHHNALVIIAKQRIEFLLGELP